MFISFVKRAIFYAPLSFLISDGLKSYLLHMALGTEKGR